MGDKKISVMVATHIIDADTNPYIENEMLLKTILSSKEKMGLQGVDYYIYIDDKFRKKYPKLFKQYVDYLLGEFQKPEFQYINIEIVEDSCELLKGNWMHMIKNCKTPYFLFLEHDWEFVRDVPTEEIIEVMDKNEHCNYVKFPKNNLGPGNSVPWDNRSHWKKHGGCFETETDMDTDLPLTRIAYYSGNPHIVKVSKCREFYVPQLLNYWAGATLGTSHLEKEFMRIINKDIHTLGDLEAHKKWGVFLYGVWDNFPLVVKHLGDWCRKR